MTEIDASEVPSYRNRFGLGGKVFVVFGAGNGIGRQSAHAVAQLGAHVICVGRSAAPTEAVARQVGGTAMLADVTQRADVEALFERVMDEHGRVDGIIDVVALSRPKPFAELDEADWQWQFDNVLGHAILALQVGVPCMEKSGGGSVTFVGTLGAMRSVGAPGSLVHYAVMKAGLHHLAVVAGTQFGPKNVRVNCVVPGLTLTPRVVKNLGPAACEAMARDYPLRRMPDATDIAGAIAFLATDLARNVTSQVLVVDGGLSGIAPAPLGPSQYSP